MSDDLFESPREGQESGISEERHGRGILTLIDGQPYRATGCLLPNNEVTDAICLAARGEVQVWTRRVHPSKHSCRRGRLIVDPGIALRFVDEPSADVPMGYMIAKPSLERDLIISPRIQVCIRSKLFALLLYVALWSVEWRHQESGELWSISARGAEYLFYLLRGEAGFYSWYLFQYERTFDAKVLDEIVLAEIEALGWIPVT